MGQTTRIEWTDATWNPWHGCHKISPGCKLCYMFRDKARYGQDPNVVVRSKTKFREPLNWPEPRLVFTCSWSDWFIEEADPWRDEAYEVIRQTPQHTYQILTKRIDRARGHIPDPPLPNIWLGVSAENQQYADERIPLLLQTPAVLRFVSYEPALGPVNLEALSHDGKPSSDDQKALNALTGEFRYYRENDGECADWGAHLDWVIVGGESGPSARPFDIQWARDMVTSCKAVRVPCFVKQLGAFLCEYREAGTAKGGSHVPIRLKDRKGGDMSEWPEDLRVRQLPEASHG